MYHEHTKQCRYNLKELNLTTKGHINNYIQSYNAKLT